MASVVVRSGFVSFSVTLWFRPLSSSAVNSFMTVVVFTFGRLFFWYLDIVPTVRTRGRFLITETPQTETSCGRAG